MYKKITILFLLLTCYAFKCIGQKQNKIDSLLYELSYAKIDTVKVKILATLVFEYGSYDTKKALEYGKISLDLAKKTNYTYGIALSLRNIAHAHYIKSDYLLALSGALESIKEAHKINNSLIIATSLGVVGNVYFAQKESKKALEYYRESLEVAQLANDKSTMTSALNRIGRVHLSEGNYTQAITSLNKAIILARQIKSQDKESDCLFYLGKTYLMQKDYQKALLYLHQCLLIDKKIEDNMSLTMSLKEIAKTHYLTKQLDSAVIYSNNALTSVLLLNSKQEMQEIYEVMYQIYKEKKNTEKALYYHEQMMILKDSIYSRDKINAITDLQANFDIQKQQMEIEKQNIAIELHEKTIEEQGIIRNIFIVGFVITTFLGYLFYQNYKRVKKNSYLTKTQNQLIKEQAESLQAMNEELNQQNEEMSRLNDNLEKLVSERTNELKLTIENLSKQNQDLEQFSYIISHNLRAPVARILGLVNVFDRSEIVSSANQRIITHLEKSSQNLDEVIKDLTQIISIRKNLTSTKEQVNIPKEIENILNYFVSQIKENNIQIEYNLQSKYVLSIKSYIQSILFNLLSNAIKYKSTKRSLVVSISSEIENNFVCISIQDNGIGIDLTNMDMYKIFGLYQRMHDHVEGKGLGLYLVKTQVEFLNGKIEIDSELDVGTTFKVYFPM